ncbi:uncharacterized protein FA14DRAFT_169498 [Meira miltonrushii]|uniref:Uncharacterized protein n=1 Tax=Meira miltonrushii TaxID=1280837 RepID=A0A316VGY3_9BASI|nr:uncharacterized protein FA14DRAFT_169498 [Meira miltonrushii]PWN36504.1 hypothetical protein FA14DRAFT_169498 [Meira miltonrushii]
MVKLSFSERKYINPFFILTSSNNSPIPTYSLPKMKAQFATVAALLLALPAIEAAAVMPAPTEAPVLQKRVFPTGSAAVESFLKTVDPAQLSTYFSWAAHGDGSFTTHAESFISANSAQYASYLSAKSIDPAQASAIAAGLGGASGLAAAGAAGAGANGANSNGQNGDSGASGKSGDGAKGSSNNGTDSGANGNKNGTDAGAAGAAGALGAGAAGAAGANGSNSTNGTSSSADGANGTSSSSAAGAQRTGGTNAAYSLAVNMAGPATVAAVMLAFLGL